jgi:PAS domain S-box-containing protein
MNDGAGPVARPPAVPAPAAAPVTQVPPDALRGLAMLEEVLESMSDGFFAYDGEWRCVRMNRAAREMISSAGFDPDALIGRVIWDAIPGLIGGPFHTNMLQAAREQAPIRFEAPGTASGRWVETTAVPISSGMAAFSHDIGDRKRARIRERMLTQAGSLLSRPTGLATTLREVARTATQEFCDTCVVTTVPQPGPGSVPVVDLVETAHQAGAGDALRELHARFPLPEDAAFAYPYVIRTGQSQIIQGAQLATSVRAVFPPDDAHLELLRRADLQSVLVVPLAAHERIFGAMTFIRHSASRGGSFDGDDLRSAEELGSRAAMALDNARLFRAERAARERAERLQDLATALSAATTVEDVAEAILNEGMAVVGATGGRVARPGEPGEDVLHVVQARGWVHPELDAYEPIPLDGAIPTADAVRTGEIVWVREAEMPDRYPQLAPLTAGGEHLTWIAVPFRHEDRTLGAVGLALPDDRAASEDLLGLLRTMAQQCAQTLERIRLFEAAEAARQEAERERADLTAVLEVTPIGIGIARDRSCTDIRANPALAAQLGTTNRDNVSKSRPDGERLPFRVFDNGRELTPDELPMQRAARDGVAVSDLLIEVVHDDGHVVQLLEYAAPLLDDEGEPRGAVGAFVDVTERARLLEAEREARREAESARAEAEAASKAKSDFLAMMSHELRTPLNAIAGYVELLELGIRGPVNDQQKSDLQRIRNAQRTLLRRIDDVLSFARIEAGQVEFDVTSVSVEELIAGVEPLVAPQVAARAIDYVCDPCDPAIRVRADAEKASQVLLNLVANALKFTPTGGSVRVAAERNGDEHVVISVTDTGVGIPQDKIETIFDPFMQVDTRLTREHGGAGLGLAISRDLMRGMGGDLSAESTVGAGSTFRVILS